MTNEPTNIVTVQMEKDQSMTVSLNGRELQDVVQIHPTFKPVVIEEMGTAPCVPAYDTVVIELRVAQYNLLQPKASVEEQERLRRGKLLAAHEEGQCIVGRPKSTDANDRPYPWAQINPSRDGWDWDNYEYRTLASE